MIDIQSVKMLMAGRAGVYGLLADAFSFPMDMENIYNLCKYLYDLTESVEVIDEQEEIMQGFKGLAEWYSSAQKTKAEWVEEKLKEEFKYTFQSTGSAIGIIFPNSDNVYEFYNKFGYTPQYDGRGINEMLSFMSYMAVETAKKDNLDDISQMCKSQLEFLNTFLLPYVSAFCEALYETALDFGIYQYIAVILHGFLMLDEPALKYF